MNEDANIYKIIRVALDHLVNAFAERAELAPLPPITCKTHLAQVVAYAAQRAADGEVAEVETLAPLRPVLSQVSLSQPISTSNWGYTPDILSLTQLLPKENLAEVSFDLDWWEAFTDKIARIDQRAAPHPLIDSQSLLAVAEKYLAHVPSTAAYDVSLYAHIHVTVALATCLMLGWSAEERRALIEDNETKAKAPFAVMVRGDFSGIQNFIYHVTRPVADTSFRGISKRLRGRSFYLTLLGDVFTNWLIRKMGVSPANILFCGGGRFDLLIPQDNATLQTFAQCEATIQDWLLDTFEGELGLQFATRLVAAEDLSKVPAIYSDLEDVLGLSKTRKWHKHILDTEFHAPKQPTYHACRVCHLVPTGDSDEVCPLCERQHRIGGKLPDTKWLAFAYDVPPPLKGPESVDFERFDTTVLLLNDCEQRKFMQQMEGQAVLYKLNATDFLPCTLPSSLGFSFRFLANTAPVALEKLKAVRVSGEATEKHDVLDFDQIAALSAGAQRLGVLKADVDHLGLIFSGGVRPLTLARQVTLSRALDRFFLGRLNSVCDEVFQAWQRQAGDKGQTVSHCFYVLYAGGDDLFVVGPWDQTLKLAARLQADFKTYACENSNVTLSAGIIQVRPHYPIQRFAHLAEEALENAKEKGRNRITVFNHTMTWKPQQPSAAGYTEILRYADQCRNAIETNQFPRTFIHYIGRLYREHFSEEPIPNLMWLPKLYYAMRRRLSADVIEELDLPHYLCFKNMMAHAPILVNYVSLSTRKE